MLANSIPAQTRLSPIGHGYQAEGPYASAGRTRTPSPTPSELEEINRPVVNWKKLFNWRTWAKKKYIGAFNTDTLISILIAMA